jgi:hypothetical protein
MDCLAASARFSISARIGQGDFHDLDRRAALAMSLGHVKKFSDGQARRGG